MLHELVGYASAHGIAGEAGFTPKLVRWLITFDSDGRFLGVIDLAGGNRESKGQEYPRAPHLKFSGDTPMRQFLVDTAKFVVLLGEESPSHNASAADRKAWEKLLTKREYFFRLLRAASAADPFLGVVADRLSEEGFRDRIRAELEAQSPKCKPTDNVTFAEVSPDGNTRIIVALDHWHDWWRGYFPTLFEAKKQNGNKRKANGNLMRCFLSGQLAPPSLTHPKIKGLADVGGNAETTLVAFNKDAFCSYGLKKSANSAMSDEMCQQYAAALNGLIARRGHRLAGAKVVYWYTGEVDESAGEDPLAPVFNPTGLTVSADDGEDDDEPDEVNSGADEKREYDAVKRARELLVAIRSGNRSELRNARYCALTLSGNKARVVVRDWMEGQFEQLVENIVAWFDDLSIVSRDGSRIIEGHKFGAVLAASVRELSNIASPLVSTLWHCSVQNQPIPHEIMAQTLARVRIDIINDEPARHARVGLLKSYCLRKEIPMTTGLNPDHTDPAYLCGRLFAVLAYIQYKALGDVGAGVVQRYYAAASATPALVLGRLIRTAQFHLSKIDDGKVRRGLDKRLGEIWDKFTDRVPTTLTLEQQTLFALGYYHQKAYRGEAGGELPLDEAT